MKAKAALKIRSDEFKALDYAIVHGMFKLEHREALKRLRAKLLALAKPSTVAP